jgi:hypothetical protein
VTTLNAHAAILEAAVDGIGRGLVFMLDEDV